MSGSPAIATSDSGCPTFTVRVSEHEQLLLKSLLAQLRTLLKVEGGGDITEDSGVRRLFPNAYPGRDDLEADYLSLIHISEPTRPY